MHYRVVLQGRTLGGADVDQVKRDFARVTGLPARVAEMYFNGMPQAVKRKLEKDDAERIAATLRAIGAAASVEREIPQNTDESKGEIRLMANPLMSGPPTIIPGMMGGAMSATPVRQPRWLRDLREKWPVIVGIGALGLGAIHLAPIVDDFIQTVSPPPPPAKAVKRAPLPATEAAPVALNPALLHGPWRCTDQRAGTPAYWTFQDDGRLIFHGDTFKDGTLVASVQKNAPSGWKLEGDRLQFSYPHGATETFSVVVLTLANLRYDDERRRIDIDCRRP